MINKYEESSQTNKLIIAPPLCQDSNRKKKKKNKNKTQKKKKKLKKFL